MTEATDILAFGQGNIANARTRVDATSPHANNATPEVGDKIGKYVVERVIGSGGMGIVVAARNESLNELVAIKLLRPKAAGDAIQSQRFTREARATMRIKSEHVVRVIDAGATHEGAPYIVMEYLIGRDLQKILQEEGPIPWPTAVDLMLQVCEAVAAAHAQGIVHRDLKPSNFFVTRRADGSALVKVLDFGISKAIKSGDQNTTVDPKLTETQAVFGSPTYMSPEQIRSAKHVDQRSDVWSLGVALFEVMTRKLPFIADNVPGLLASIVADAPFPPRSFVPDIPPALEAVILACLEKDLTQRIQSVSELAARLQPFASQTSQAVIIADRIQRIAGASGSVIPPPLTSGRAPPAAPSTGRHSGAPPAPPVAFGTTGMDLADSAPASRKGSWFVGIGIFALVLTAVLLGSVYAYQRGKEAASATAPPPLINPIATTMPPANPTGGATLSSATAPAPAPAPLAPASSFVAAGAAPTTTTTATATHHRPSYKTNSKKTSSPSTSTPATPTTVTDPTRDRF